MSLHAKWNNMLPTLFEKRARYAHIQQARPVLAYIKVHNAPILCSFVWRIHHADWQVAELLTTTCQISETTGWYTVYNILRRIMRSGNKPEFPFSDSYLSQYTSHSNTNRSTKFWTELTELCSTVFSCTNTNMPYLYIMYNILYIIIYTNMAWTQHVKVTIIMLYIHASFW
jgi:hypothetical protein